jgi:hypothetical protein
VCDHAHVGYCKVRDCLLPWGNLRTSRRAHSRAPRFHGAEGEEGVHSTEAGGASPSSELARSKIGALRMPDLSAVFHGPGALCASAVWSYVS